MVTTHSMVIRHGYARNARYRVVIAKTDSYGSALYHREVEEIRTNLLDESVWNRCRGERAFDLLLRAWSPLLSEKWVVIWQSEGRRICARRDAHPDAELRSADYFGAERWRSIRGTPEEGYNYDNFAARVIDDLCRDKLPSWWRTIAGATPCPRPCQDTYAACPVCGAEGDDSFKVEPGEPARVVCKCCGEGRAP